MKKILGSLVFLFPAVAFGATYNNLDDLINAAFRYGNIAIALLISFAVIYIVYAVVQFVIRGDDETQKAALKGKILYGIIGLFIILSIWGLVRFLRNTFNFGNNNAPTNDFPNVIRNY